MATVTVNFAQLVNGTVPIRMAVEECCACGTPFAITAEIQDRRRKDHAWFYCPIGHAQRYTGPSEVEQLRDEIAHVREREARARRDAEDERRKHAATKGQLTRVLKRVEAGVCPHCHRSFAQLRRHVQAKHPEQAPPGPASDLDRRITAKGD